MQKFIPKEKMSKKAQKALNRERRALWEVRPVTRVIESGRQYRRESKLRPHCIGTEL